MMIDSKLESLIHEKPSSIRNTILIRLLRFLLLIFGGVLFIVRVGLIVSSEVQFQLIDWLMMEDESHLNESCQVYYLGLIHALGIIFLIVSIIFFYHGQIM